MPRWCCTNHNGKKILINIAFIWIIESFEEGVKFGLAFEGKNGRYERLYESEEERDADLIYYKGEDQCQD